MRVIITAGGTGGHIYPAISILNKIKEEEPNSTFLYIGTHNRMEKDIVPSLGYDYKSIEIYGFSKKNIKLDFKNIKQRTAEYKPVIKISLIIYLFIICSSFFFGFSSIYSKSGGSKEKASPARVSITIFIHNIWITVTGVGIPINDPIILILTAQKLTVNWKIINFLILLKIHLP